MSLEKLDLASPNLVNENIEKIAALFPNCVTESADGKAIDFDLLKQELSDHIVEGNKERYRLEWPGKREAIVTANLPTTKTLRPVRKDSVDFDNTENLYIEGDNLEVLKLLQESYLGKVKMIYIDPPYNTGKDFVYKDNFKEGSKQHQADSGQIDEYGRRLIANPETAGRYHSDWLSMMYPRLKLARNLLTNDGVIFMSIDDHEKNNLLKIGNEIFGENNFVGEVSIITGANQSGQDILLQKNIESCLIYSKQYDSCLINKIDKTAETLRNLNDTPTGLIERPNMGYTIYYHPVTKKLLPVIDYKIDDVHLDDEKIYEDDKELIQQGYVPIRPGRRNNRLHTWRWGIETFRERIENIEISKKNGTYKVKFKQAGYNPPKNIWNFSGGTIELKSLFDGSNVFKYSKGLNFLSYIIELGTEDNSIFLDFFSGSASSAHALFSVNAKDLGKRKFIHVQLPEAIDSNSDLYKHYKTICDIGKERIRRAGNKIKEDTEANIDYGFRVYRLDESNMQDVYYKPQEYDQGQLDAFADNVKPDRTPDDLLAQVMIDWGLPLSLKIERIDIKGKEVFKVAENSLYACFDEGIEEDFAKEIAKDSPLRIVFKDSGFKDDTAKTNVKQLLKQLSPETEMKVI